MSALPIRDRWTVGHSCTSSVGRRTCSDAFVTDGHNFPASRRNRTSPHQPHFWMCSEGMEMRSARGWWQAAVASTSRHHSDIQQAALEQFSVEPDIDSYVAQNSLAHLLDTFGNPVVGLLPVVLGELHLLLGTFPAIGQVLE